MIRPLTADDKDKFLPLMKMFIDERMGEFGLTYDPVMSGIQFDCMIKDANIGGLVIDNDGEIDGAIVAAFAPLLFCHGTVAQELVWYVKPASRGFEGLRLIKEFTKLSFQRGCFGIMMVGMAGDRSNEYYTRDGYQALENIYFKKIGELS